MSDGEAVRQEEPRVLRSTYVLSATECFGELYYKTGAKLTQMESSLGNGGV